MIPLGDLPRGSVLREDTWLAFLGGKKSSSLQTPFFLHTGSAEGGAFSVKVVLSLGTVLSVPAGALIRMQAVYSLDCLVSEVHRL